MKINLKSADKSEEKLFYACDEEDIVISKIGHMRLDFGNGRQFYGTWFSGNDELNVAFNESFKVVLGGKSCTSAAGMSRRHYTYIV